MPKCRRRQSRQRKKTNRSLCMKRLRKALALWKTSSKTNTNEHCSTKSPTTKPPTTKPPTTKSPTTKPPTTKPPTTKPPTTKSPTTKSPTTKPPAPAPVRRLPPPRQVAVREIPDKAVGRVPTVVDQTCLLSRPALSSPQGTLFASLSTKGHAAHRKTHPPEIRLPAPSPVRRQPMPRLVALREIPVKAVGRVPTVVNQTCLPYRPALSSPQGTLFASLSTNGHAAHRKTNPPEIRPPAPSPVHRQPMPRLVALREIPVKAVGRVPTVVNQTCLPYRRALSPPQGTLFVSLSSNGHAARRKTHPPEISRGVRADASLVPPIRQTASIFKQPVTVIRTQEGKVKPDFKHGPPDKPKQLFWEKRLEGLRACDVDGSELNAMELPRGLRAVGPHVGDETLLQSVATALHVSTQPVTGQTGPRSALDRNPGVFLNPEQPLVQAVCVADEDIKKQEDRVVAARKKLQDALKAAAV